MVLRCYICWAISKIADITPAATLLLVSLLFFLAFSLASSLASSSASSLTSSLASSSASLSASSLAFWSASLSAFFLAVLAASSTAFVLLVRHPTPECDKGLSLPITQRCSNHQKKDKGPEYDTNNFSGCQISVAVVCIAASSIVVLVDENLTVAE